MSTNVLVKSLAILGVAVLCSPAAQATTITVQNLGSILNDSVSFPSTKTPGSSGMFEDYFEFTLPTAEYITASMSLSGPVVDQIPAGTGWASPGAVATARAPATRRSDVHRGFGRPADFTWRPEIAA